MHMYCGPPPRDLSSNYRLVTVHANKRIDILVGTFVNFCTYICRKGKFLTLTLTLTRTLTRTLTLTVIKGENSTNHLKKSTSDLIKLLEVEGHLEA